MGTRLRLSTRYGMNTAIFVAIFIGIIILIEAFSYRHNWRKDFTSNKRHSLSEQTLNVLRDLNEQIKIVAFVWKGSPVYEEVKRLFELYKHESEALDVALIDPDLNPNLANEYEVGRYQIPVAFFEGKSGRETITDINEEQATNALIKVSRGKKKAVYFLTGHGERLLDSTDDTGLSVVKKLLEDKHYDPQPLMLMRAEQVPEDCAILLVCGPEKDLTEAELGMIKRYIQDGGRVFVLIDPEAAPLFKAFLGGYGMVLGDDIVVDRLSRLFGGDYLMPVPTSYSDHAITKDFNIAPFFPVARSVSTADVPGVRTTWLVQTGERSWAETDIEGLKAGKASFDPDKDIEGPISLAAVSEVEIPESEGEGPEEPKQGAIVVFGDSDFVTNARANLSGNSAIFMNAINWLAREEVLIAIPPKESKFAPVVLTASDARMLFFLPVIVLPGMVLVGGIYVFIKRSRHP